MRDEVGRRMSSSYFKEDITHCRLVGFAFDVQKILSLHSEVGPYVSVDADREGNSSFIYVMMMHRPKKWSGW